MTGTQHLLFMDDKVFSDGGVALTCNAPAQPSRVAYSAMTRFTDAVHQISKCKGNIVIELDGRDAVEVVRELPNTDH